MGLLADTDTCVDVSRIVMVDETECVETESCGDVNCTFMVQHPVLYHSTVSRHPSEPCYVEILDAPDILHNHFLTQVSLRRTGAERASQARGTSSSAL